MRELIRTLRLRLRGLLKRRQLDRDLQDELAYHLELRRANAPAQAPFGNVTAIRETCRDVWTFVQLEDLWRDVRHAARVLRRTPGHTASIVLLLALGIGTNSAIFSLMHAALFRELAVENPEQLVELNRVDDRRPSLAQGISAPLFEDFRQRQTSLSGLAAFGGVGNAPVAIGDQDLPLSDTVGVLASGNYFEVLGIRPAFGRLFTEEDDRFADPRAVVVLGYGFWKRHYGEDRGVLGRRLYVSGNPFTIIGVAPEEFWSHTAGQKVDFWIPLNMQPAAWSVGDRRTNRGSSWLRMMGRLKPGVSIQKAQAEVSTLFAQVKVEQADKSASSMLVEPGNRGLGGFRQQYGTPLQILMGAAALLLLIACTNVASLLLARAGTRQREIAVRQALGCSRTRLVRQFFVESALLAAAGGAFGLALAPWSSQALLALASAGTPILLDTSLDGTLLLFGTAVSFASALGFGLVPALGASQAAIEPALRSASKSATASRSRQLANRSLVAVQVAFCVVLVAGAVLFVRSLYRLYTADAGFDRDQVITVTVDTRVAGYQSPERYADLARRLTERVSALPGVRSVSVAAAGFLSGASRGTGTYRVEDRRYSFPDAPTLRYNEVSNNYLEALGVDLVAGRGFAAGDRAGAPLVAVVNEAFVRYYLPGQNPVGKRFGIGRGERESIEIVGVVRDSKYNDLRETSEPLAFLPFEQFPARFNHVLAKLEGPPNAVLAAIRPAILQVDPKLRLDRLQTLDEALDRTLSRDILLGGLTGVFGALALVLACFGVYGVISYLVVSRTPEIGVRLAIGAQRGTVLRQVIGDALKTVAPGIVLGIGAAMAAERFIESLLFGAKARDPLTYGSVAACLLLATALAAYLPARRASRIDPVNALRCE